MACTAGRWVRKHSPEWACENRGFASISKRQAGANIEKSGGCVYDLFQEGKPGTFEPPAPTVLKERKEDCSRALKAWIIQRKNREGDSNQPAVRRGTLIFAAVRRSLLQESKSIRSITSIHEMKKILLLLLVIALCCRAYVAFFYLTTATKTPAPVVVTTPVSQPTQVR